MLFNTIDFIIFFVVVVTTLIIVKNRKFQHLFLLFASYFFFYYSSNYLIVLLIYTTVWDFYLGKQIWKANTVSRKKKLLALSLAGNLGLLGLFKYTDFAITQFNILGNYFDLNTMIPHLNFILPIGISFYTFHSITYIVGIYRGELNPAKSFTEYAIFVAFFPQLVAGPILRAKDFLPQLQEKMENLKAGVNLRQILIHSLNLKLGLTLMAFGFVKKMFFADNISPLVNSIFGNPVGLESFTIILGAISFGIQIYCDFSGYTDIAIGVATILGFKMPINFNKPYFATSATDFWRRWHISLSTWLRDYLYIPLGGNRKSNPRTYFNIFVVMFIGGLWHGAAWNFVIWGTLHGFYLTIQKILSSKIRNPRITSFFTGRIGIVVSIFITQYFIFLAWIAFRVRDLDYLAYSIKKYVILDFATTGTINFVLSHWFSVVLIPLFIGLHFLSYKRKDLREYISNFKLRYFFCFLVGVMLLILLFYDGNPENFIYFQF